MRISNSLLPIAAALAGLTVPSAAYAQSQIDYLTSVDEATLAQVFTAFDAAWEKSERDDGTAEYQVTLSSGLLIMAVPLVCDEDLQCEQIAYYAQFTAPQGMDRPRLLEVVNAFNFNHAETSAALFNDNNIIVQLAHRVSQGSSLESVAYSFRRFGFIAAELNTKLYENTPE